MNYILIYYVSKKRSTKSTDIRLWLKCIRMIAYVVSLFELSTRSLSNSHTYLYFIKYNALYFDLYLYLKLVFEKYCCFKWVYQKLSKKHTETQFINTYTLIRPFYMHLPNFFQASGRYFVFSFIARSLAQWVRISKK